MNLHKGRCSGSIYKKITKKRGTPAANRPFLDEKSLSEKTCIFFAHRPNSLAPGTCGYLWVLVDTFLPVGITHI